METIDKTGPLEREMVCLLLQAYRHPPRATIGPALSWMEEEILSASQASDQGKRGGLAVGELRGDGRY